VAHEGHPPLVGDLTRLGLGDVVHQRAEAQRLAAGELVGERLVQRRRQPPGLGVAQADRPRVLHERDRLTQHGAGVAGDVEVVIATLLHAVQRRQLGQHGGGHAQRVHELQALQRARRAQERLELGERPLGGHRGQVRRARLRPGDGLRLRREAELGGEPGQAQRAQRVVGEAARRDRAQPPRLQVGHAAERVDPRAVSGERLRDRVDGQVAPPEVLLERRLAEPQHVELPAVVARDHPPGSEGLRERERVAAGPAARGPRHRLGIAGDDHVEVGGRALQQPVADRAADQPRRRPEGRDRMQRIAGHPRTGVPSRCQRRVTRSLMPHRTSW
jgi:hypothetical protein